MQGMEKGQTLIDESLFRPTLTDADDVVEFGRPWDPRMLIFVSFFGDLALGGILYSLNARRLSMRKLEWLYIPISLACAWLYWGTVIYFVKHHTEAFKANAKWVDVGYMAWCLIVSSLFLMRQKRRFHMFSLGKGRRETWKWIIPLTIAAFYYSDEIHMAHMFIAVVLMKWTPLL